MTEAAFLANAVMSLAALALCVWHAVPDRDRLTFLATGVVYGVVLEQLVIVGFEAYTYNVDDFLLVLGDVPLVIGFGWAALIYSGYEIGRHLSLSRRALPPFVALFALHVDLAIDAVAIRVPFWRWTPPGAWFGVPLGNFFGWFLVASLFTAGWVVVRQYTRSRPLAAGGTFVGAVVALVALLEVWTTVVTTLPRAVAVLGTAVVGAAVVVVRDGITPAPIDARLAAVPLLYHLFYLALLVGLGIYRTQPALLGISLAMLAVGSVVHVDAFRRWGRRLPAT